MVLKRSTREGGNTYPEPKSSLSIIINVIITIVITTGGVKSLGGRFQALLSARKSISLRHILVYEGPVTS
ncbi:hypothetical protein E2C01_070767 [Portunus trituberculatus]|uniref:Uncharacterized protein n=1 Tax=Portunus trituberculatus TaxID=210409 RepID=A0A5B7I4H6_PORTR|nr:hypothetical protein [Portunus trituberculatus]